MTRTEAGNELARVWSTGHPGVTSVNQAGINAAMNAILGKKITGEGAGVILPHMIKQPRKTNR